MPRSPTPPPVRTDSSPRARAFCALAALILCASLGPPAWAEDTPLPIGRVLEDPDEYHLTTVTLEGAVIDVQPIEPYYAPSGAACYGAYTFVLDDGSGSLTVDVLGFCGTPVFRPPPIAKGDRVILKAHIRTPRHQGYFKGVVGAPLPERDRSRVRGIAEVIRPASAPAPDLLHPKDEDGP